MGNNLYSNLVNFYNVNDENFKEFMAEIYKEMLTTHRDVQYVKEHLTEEIEKILDKYLIDGKFNINIEEKVNEFLENNQEIKDINTKLNTNINNIENITSQLGNNVKNTPTAINIKEYKYETETNYTKAFERVINNLGENGGAIFIDGIIETDQIILDSNIKLFGNGKGSTLLQSKDSNKDFIIKKDVKVHNVQICDLNVMANELNNNITSGISFIGSTDRVPKIIDHYNIIENVYVSGFKKIGIEIRANRETNLNKCVVKYCDTGFYIKTSDSNINNCSVSNCNIGYDIVPYELRLNNCKSFYNEIGFSIHDGHSIVMNNSTSQSDLQKAFDINNVRRIMSQNTILDSFGSPPELSYRKGKGIVLNNVVNAKINGTAKLEYSDSSEIIVEIAGHIENVNIDLMYSNGKTYQPIFVNNISKVANANSSIKINNIEKYKIDLFKYDTLKSIISNCYDNSVLQTFHNDFTYISKFDGENMTIEINSNTTDSIKEVQLSTENHINISNLPTNSMLGMYCCFKEISENIKGVLGMNFYDSNKALLKQVTKKFDASNLTQEAYYSGIEIPENTNYIKYKFAINSNANQSVGKIVFNNPKICLVTFNE